MHIRPSDVAILWDYLFDVKLLAQDRDVGYHKQLNISSTHRITQDAITGVVLLSNSGSKR